MELREGILRGSLERRDPGARPEASKGLGQLFPGRKAPVQRPEVGATLCTDPPPGQLWVGELSFSLDNSVGIIHTRTIHPFKLYASVVSSLLTELCKRHHGPFRTCPSPRRSLILPVLCCPSALTGLNHLLSLWSRPIRTFHEMETAHAVLLSLASFT